MRNRKISPRNKAKNTTVERIDGGGLKAVREHRDDLEALAETDLPASTWAERLLDILDEQDTGGDSR